MQIEYIAAGDYLIATSGNKLLKALLGSCVGVAILDREAKVGGILHVLLPDPPSPDSKWSPYSHAGSGLPLFIDALIQAGAQSEHLQAVVAGGALFGGISHQDIALNIGGRCIDRVHDILRNYRIPIVKEESCGLSSSILCLDTSSWTVTIASRFDPPQPGAVAPTRPGREALETALGNIPPVPQSAIKLFGLLSEEQYDPAEIVAIIETDQILAAKALSLCNSALVGLKPPVETIDKAVLILGGQNLLSLVATAAVDSLLNEPHSGYALQKGGLYKHALAVAYASRTLATEVASQETPPGLAYAAGLLHDIGKIGLDHYFASCRPLFYQDSTAYGDELTSMERRLLGLDHQEAGLFLARSWGLPESITQTIGFHHQPESSPGHQRLVALICLADMLASWYLTGMVVQRIDPTLLLSRLKVLGLQPKQLASLIEQIPWKEIMYL